MMTTLLRPAIGLILILAAAHSQAAVTDCDQPGHPVALSAEPFPLSQVRLMDGPFRDAMVRDENYLLSLDCNRLLYNFFINANLPTQAQPYGGWEAPKSELRGHSVGHYGQLGPVPRGSSFRGADAGVPAD
jgi:hypothetical protein